MLKSINEKTNVHNEAGAPLVYHKRDPAAPRDAVYCGRPGKWGNPFKLRRGASDAERRAAVARFRDYVDGKVASGDLDIGELRGKALTCWCAPIGKPLQASGGIGRCHAQYLLWLAR